MTRLSILPALLIGLALIGCAPVPSPSGQSPAVPVPGTQGTTTGSFVPGADPESPVVTVGRDQIDLTQQNSAQNILLNSSAGPLLTIRH